MGHYYSLNFVFGRFYLTFQTYYATLKAGVQKGSVFDLRSSLVNANDPQHPPGVNINSKTGEVPFIADLCFISNNIRQFERELYIYYRNSSNIISLIVKMNNNWKLQLCLRINNKVMIKVIFPFNKKLKGGKGNGDYKALAVISFLFCCHYSWIKPRWNVTIINTIS